MLTMHDLLLVCDPTLFLDVPGDPNDWTEEWRYWLKNKLYDERHQRSDVSFRPLGDRVEMHEGILSRARVPHNVSWHWRIYSGINCFLLLPEEHRPQPPDPVTCYWISVARYGKRRVDGWLNLLPFKSIQDRPWRGSRGDEVIDRIPEQYAVDPEFYRFYQNPVIVRRLQQDA